MSASPSSASSSSPVPTSVPAAPDTKDWTWVLERPCPECGLDATALGVGDLPRLVQDTTTAWTEVLARPDVRVRPAPTTWSPLEYGAHVRDVHAVFAERLRLMLAEDAPRFADWDQDAAAVAGDYAALDPDAVAVGLVEAAGTVAALYAGVGDAERDRPGHRSNGSVFTVETLGRYHLHDVVHHLADVGAR